MNKNTRPVTIDTLRQFKKQSEKFTCLTAYDSTFAHLLDEQGIDVILVGDSMGMVIQGEKSTVPVSLEEIIYHARCVERGIKRSMLMVDMPFMTYATVDDALYNAARLMREGRAHMVKLEGGELQVGVVNALTERGIPVCAHLGLTPQSVHKLGGYKVQGREERVAQTMLNDALSLQQAGADMLLLECVPSELAAKITQQSDVPVIGIGAGNTCDAQVLVLYDMLGITPGHVPKFTKNFMQDNADIQSAITAYINAVKSGEFPDADQSFN